MALSDCICFECHLLIQRLYSIYTSNTLLAGMRRCTVRCTLYQGLCSTPEGWSVILCFSLCDFGIRAILLIALGSAHPFSYWVTNCYQGKRALFPSSESLMPSFFQSHSCSPWHYPPIHAACCERLPRHISLILKKTLISGTVWRGKFLFQFRKTQVQVLDYGMYWVQWLRGKKLKIINKRIK